MQGFDVLDVVVFFFLVFSILIGFFRGFLKELLSLVAWIVSFVVSVAGYSLVYGKIDKFQELDSPVYIKEFWAFFSLFVVSILVFSIIRFIVTVFVSSVSISPTNHLFGMIMAFFKACIIIYIGLMFLQNAFLKEKDFTKDSVVFTEAQPYFIFSKDKK